MSTPLGVMLACGGHAPAHAALLMAAGAAALGREVVVFATGPGCHVLAGTVPEPEREAALSARGVATIAELLEAVGELGVRLIACEAGLRGEALAPEALPPGVEVAGVATFLEATRGAQLLAF